MKINKLNNIGTKTLESNNIQINNQEETIKNTKTLEIIILTITIIVLFIIGAILIRNINKNNIYLRKAEEFKYFLDDIQQEITGIYQGGGSINFIYELYKDSIEALYVNGTIHKLDEQYPRGKHSVRMIFKKNIVFTNTSYMFKNCFNVKFLNFSKFDVSNVVTMRSMFADCSDMESLDFSNFNTSKVVDMSYMFQMCKSLTSIDISKLNTSSVENMMAMFYDCASIKSLDFSHFDTSSVTTMSSMYQYVGLTSLDLPFNTSKVTDMSHMFRNSLNLSFINLTKFNTSSVETMENMFTETAISSLDVSNFNTSLVTNLISMFEDNKYLKSLNLSNFDTRKVTHMGGMFYRCRELESLDISNFNTSSLKNSYLMFDKCDKLSLVYCNDTNLSEILKRDIKITCTPKDYFSFLYQDNLI